MPCFICRTCGTQHALTERPPERCAICDEERQYIPEAGQSWTTIEALRISHRIAYRQYEPQLIGLGMEPSFAIGQRALLIRRPAGNILWDCVSLIDDATIAIVRALGGISAIAISHPHYYSSVVEWSRAFDNVPVYLHAADRQWCMRRDPSIRSWDGEQMPLGPGLTLIRAGGHFEGGTILHWVEGAQGRGALLTGDIIQVNADRRSVSFMYSYPNFIPLPSSEVTRMAALVEPLRFEAIYGAWWDKFIPHDGPSIVQASAARRRNTP